MNLSYQFKGVVSKIRYDVKGIPYVTVNGSGYYLNAGYGFSKEIEQGDSLIKHKGSTIYKLIKKDSGTVIDFDNQYPGNGTNE